MTTAAWICLLSPLGAVLAITLAGTSITRRAAGYLATASVGVSFVAALVTFVTLTERADEEREEISTLWTWLTAGEFEVGLSILVDPLSVFMMLVVSGVGFLIVAYSIGYMDGDDEERRYFAYMALFVFSMLLLVQSANLLILLAGWGLVGLCSYLLIGYHHDRPAAVAAAKKAFIMNAFGDATMALAFFVLIWEAGSLTLDFDSVPVDGTIATLVALGLLGGAVAKSAQIPLHTWLPDAMEGPTPVSALIHAATMVTAGVYLLVRLSPVFEAASEVQDLAAGLGAITLLVAGLVALVQTDIKRVIAYSTMSQIGYMFLGAGLGAYAGAMFLLMTHAFFKALLFLGAGIVIHALSGEQDMRKMGGLRSHLPRTWLAMLIGALALTGIPPLAGFFSKDAILAATLEAGAYGQLIFAAGLAGTFLTGLYAFRMMFIVFGGDMSPYAREHLHRPESGGEGSFSMTSTVAVLALLSVIGGWIEVAELWHPLTDFLEPVVGPVLEPTRTQELVTSILAVGLALAGMFVAWRLYGARRAQLPQAPFWRALLERKFYFDEAYDLLFYRPAAAAAHVLIGFVENPVIRGSIEGVSTGTRRVGQELGGAQTGLVRTYALTVAGSVAVLALVFVVVR